MKILFVTNSIGMGGASVALINILQYSKENNITPFVTCPKKGEFSDTLDKLGIPFLIIGNPLEIYPKVYSWKAFIKYPYSFLLVYTNLKVYHFLIKKCTTPNRLRRYA